MGERYYDFLKQTVRVGTEQVPRHSEASVIERKDGSLLMAWQHHTKAVVTDCGVCETRCPYNLPIRQMMKEVAAKFGK